MRRKVRNWLLSGLVLVAVLSTAWSGSAKILPPESGSYFCVYVDDQNIKPWGRISYKIYVVRPAQSWACVEKAVYLQVEKAMKAANDAKEGAEQTAQRALTIVANTIDHLKHKP